MKRPDAGWTFSDVEKIYTQPFQDLLFNAHSAHREHQPLNTLQVATLLSIKTGACPEDCGYCAQSGHFKTDLVPEKLLAVEEVLAHARAAKEAGAERFCMGAAWRCPPDKAWPQLEAMIAGVKALGLETCMTLGMLDSEQAQRLKDAGLDFYNHNIDTSPSYYNKVVSTRRFEDRLDTLASVRASGMQVCCGGILGLGEKREDRIEFLLTLANLSTPPESVPINRLARIAGTPLGDSEPIDNFEIVRTIATARLLMPDTKIRLTAGRVDMSDELQALCFYAGANSVFISDKLLTTSNPALEKDRVLFQKLDLAALPA